MKLHVRNAKSQIRRQKWIFYYKAFETYFFEELIILKPNKKANQNSYLEQTTIRTWL